MPYNSFPDNQESNNPELHLGQIGALIANPAINGAIIQVIQGKPENRFVVLHSGNKATYYATQLMVLEEPGVAREIYSLPAFHAYLTALQLRHPGISSLYSLNAARVDIHPLSIQTCNKTYTFRQATFIDCG